MKRPTRNSAKIIPKNRPRVLLLSFEDLGIGSSGLLAAEALSKIENIEVHWIYEKSVAGSILQEKRLGKIRGIGVKARLRKHLPLAYLQILFYCLKFRPQVVHDLSGSAFRKNLLLWPLLATFSRLVFTEHNPRLGGSVIQSLTRKVAYYFGNKFIVHGPKSQRDLLQCGIAKEKIFLSRLGHKGFYAEALSQKPERNPNEILFFGQLRPGKGLELLVQIADAVQRRCPQIKFVVAGSSEVARYFPGWREKVDGILKQMQDRPYFEVRDEFIPDDQVAGFFLRAGMVLIPYSEANQSGVMLTAMALDCPVVATAVGDIPSIIRHGENGLLCPLEIGAMANAILSLRNEPEIAQCLARRARKEVEENFNWSKIVQEFPKAVYRFETRD